MSAAAHVTLVSVLLQVLEALRQQSLHATGYAKHALLAISPATQPRRDALSTFTRD